MTAAYLMYRRGEQLGTIAVKNRHQPYRNIRLGTGNRHHYGRLSKLRYYAPGDLKGETGMAEANCDIGLIGLAVMGQNLVLNMNDHGYKVAVFNRTVSKVDDFLADEAKGTQVVPARIPSRKCAAS